VQPLPGEDPRPGVYGPQTLDELPRVIRELGLARVLLVTGKGSFQASGASRVLPALRASVEVAVWSDFSPNTDVDDLVDGVRVAQGFQPDGIIAVGGGSVLDMAKLIAAFLELDAADIPAAVRNNTVNRRLPALVLVPTTSGSGSEATHFAVAYIGPEKFSVASPALLPDFVILDPDLTGSASRYQKATSVIDAIAQAVESHWARGATTASRSFARAALRDLVPAAPAYLDGDGSAGAHAARGSYLAGRAIDLSKTTGAHALAYGLTRRHGISHGHAVATTLGAFARRHAELTTAPGASADLARDLADIAELVGADDPLEIGARLDALAADLGLELKLRELGVPHDDLTVMAHAVNTERLGNNPLAFHEDDLLALLQECW
jgi:alcohol dehydrogenase class IV